MAVTSPAAARSRAASSLALHGGTPVADAKIPLVSVALAEADIQAALGVLRSGMLVQGKHCAALEERFAYATDARFGATCANGTCALQLVYEPLIEPGDEVLVPAWTYIATVSMVVARGAIPVFCDADPETYCIDVEDAARKVTPRTTAIACTHLYGNPVDIDGVEALGAAHGLSVIYDAAQSHLARWKGSGLGAFGDAVTYSLYATKNMMTGEGGLVTTNDADLNKSIRLLRSHGETEKYIHSRVGYNYRMTDVEAAIGLSQFDRMIDLTAKRRANGAALDRMIAGIPGLKAPKVTPGGEHVYHLYAVRIEPEAFAPVGNGSARALRDEFTRALNAEGVMTAIHYPRTLTRQPVFEKPGMDHPPVAERLAETLFCIPVHQNLTDRQLAQIGESLHKVAEALRG